jgi:hypothetical protein
MFLSVCRVPASSMFTIFPPTTRNPNIAINRSRQKILVLASYPSSHHSRIHQSIPSIPSCLSSAWTIHSKSTQSVLDVTADI